MTNRDFQADDVFVFGPESQGLPQSVLDGFAPAQRLRLPMHTASRSLNLANAAAVLLYEAMAPERFCRRVVTARGECRGRIQSLSCLGSRLSNSSTARRGSMPSYNTWFTARVIGSGMSSSIPRACHFTRRGHAFRHVPEPGQDAVQRFALRQHQADPPVARKIRSRGQHQVAQAGQPP